MDSNPGASGNTPLVALNKIPKHSGIKCQIHAKLEFHNPNKTIYDRLALALVNKAESAGVIKPESTLIFGPDPEFCLALFHNCNAKKYKLIALLIDSSSSQKVKQELEKFGATIFPVLEDENGSTTQHKRDEAQSDEITTMCRISLDIKAKALTELEGCINLIDFVANNANIFDTEVDRLVEEIASSGIKPDLFVGEKDHLGILNRISEKLQDMFCNCLVFGVDSEVYSAAYKSKNFDKPCNLSFGRVVSVSEERAYVIARDLNVKENLSCGERGGAVVAGALKIIQDIFKRKKKDTEFTVITLLTDSALYSDGDFLDVDLMRDKGYMSEAEFNSLYWWYLMGVGNVNFNTFPSVVANCSLDKVSKLLKSHSRMLVWKTTDHRRDLENVLGIVTQDVLKLILQSQETGSERGQVLGDYSTSLLNYGVLNCREMLGDLDRLFKKYDVVIIFNDVWDFGVEDGDDVHFKTPLALVSVKEVQEWIYSVEEHHRQQYGWEPGVGFLKEEDEADAESVPTILPDTDPNTNTVVGSD